MLRKAFGRGFDSRLLHMKTLQEELTNTRDWHKRQIEYFKQEINDLEDKLLEKRNELEKYKKYVDEFDMLLDGQSIPWLL